MTPLDDAVSLTPEISAFLVDALEDAGLEGISPEDILLDTRRFLNREISLDCPTRSEISKLGSAKKRVVYIFPEHDAILLKLLNFTLSRMEIGLGPDCLAFRPGFSAQAAFRRMTAAASRDMCCVRVDIRNYFNSIPVDQLADVVTESLSFWPAARDAIIEILRNPWVIDNGIRRMDPAKGAMAGMPLAPLLANLYLKDFDREVGALGSVYARYSDDIILFCRPEDAEEILGKMEQLLVRRGLTMNREKTRIAAPGDPWEFVGFSYCNGEIDLSEAAIRKMQGKISRAARRLYRWKVRKNASTERAVRAMIRKFQFKFYGTGREDDELTWSRWYFPTVTKSDGLLRIDRHFQEWTRYLATGRHTKKNHAAVPYASLRSWGYVPLVSAFYKRERDPARQIPDKSVQLTRLRPLRLDK